MTDCESSPPIVMARFAPAPQQSLPRQYAPGGFHPESVVQRPGAAPWGPAFGPPPGAGSAFGPPAAARDGARGRLAIAIVVVVALALGLVGIGTARYARSSAVAVGSTWISLRGAETTSAIQGILDRRAAAVHAHDKTAFMADVDPTDATFARRQQVLYDSLVQLSFGTLSYQIEPSVTYPRDVSAGLVARFHSAVYAPGVTIHYTITGVDSRVVATPWVPVFGYAGGRWLLVDEAADKNLPYGVNGQPWDAGAIAVVKSTRVVGVLSADDSKRATDLLKLAEQGLDKVYAVRSTGWDGKVFVTAVQDRRIFDTYFANAPDRIAQVAAIAVPYYDRVSDWHDGGVFATTRVIFNPQQLSAQPEELAHDLAHEFTHAAMGPVTVTQTPRWLVEGFAEYVAYKGENVSASLLRRMLRGQAVPTSLPTDSTFYSDSAHYTTSWLACRMIAERFGEARLIALYGSFQQGAEQDANIAAVLGISSAALTAQWHDYITKKLA